MAYDPENNPYIPGDPASYDLKWVIDRLNEHKFAEESAAEAMAYAEAAEARALEASGYADDAEGYKDAASGYADDAEGYRDEAANYAANIADPVSGLVTNWLNDNITQPTTPVVDASLTVEGAAADAKAAGDRFRSIMKYYPNLVGGAYPVQTIDQTVNNNTPTFNILDTDNDPWHHFDVPVGIYYVYARFAFGADFGGNAYCQPHIRFHKSGFNNNFVMQLNSAPVNTGSNIASIGTIYDITSAITNCSIAGFIDGFGTGSRRLQLDIKELNVIKFDDLDTAKAYANSMAGGLGRGVNTPNVTYGLGLLKETTDKPVSDIIFWGDSLTAGAGGGGTTYPAVCASILGKTYKNCGVGGENCQTIAARQGGNNVVIPAGAINGTYAELKDIFGNALTPLLQGNGDFSAYYLLINGERCTLSYSGGNYTISGYTGSTTIVPTIATFIGSQFKSKVAVIWMGTNGGNYPGSSGNAETIKFWAQSMISHLEHKNFVVMGLSIGEQTASYYIAHENTLKQAFGNKYFPTREYLINYGLTLEGITPTSQDTADIAAGKVPTSLRSDATHLNAAGYDAVGKLLANKIISLGYFD